MSTTVSESQVKQAAIELAETVEGNASNYEDYKPEVMALVELGWRPTEVTE